MTKSLIRVVIALALTIVIISGCSQRVLTQKPLTDVQVEHFINEKNIKSLATKNLGNQFTVILFENEKEMGWWAVAIDEEGRETSHGGITNNNSNVMPVSVGGVATGIPFVTTIINDTRVLNQADKILVKFQDGYEVSETVNNRKGIIISNDSVRNGYAVEESVKIVNKNGEVLFKQ